jgi:hypothetical protein
LNIEFENFIDIGSSKGKPCIYVGSKNIFIKIVGVEFSKELVVIAD